MRISSQIHLQEKEIKVRCQSRCKPSLPNFIHWVYFRTLETQVSLIYCYCFVDSKNEPSRLTFPEDNGGNSWMVAATQPSFVDFKGRVRVRVCHHLLQSFIKPTAPNRGVDFKVRVRVRVCHHTPYRKRRKSIPWLYGYFILSILGRGKTNWRGQVEERKGGPNGMDE